MIEGNNESKKVLFTTTKIQEFVNSHKEEYFKDKQDNHDDDNMDEKHSDYMAPNDIDCLIEISKKMFFKKKNLEIEETKDVKDVNDVNDDGNPIIQIHQSISSTGRNSRHEYFYLATQKSGSISNFEKYNRYKILESNDKINQPSEAIYKIMRQITKIALINSHLAKLEKIPKN